VQRILHVCCSYREIGTTTVLKSVARIRQVKPEKTYRVLVICSVRISNIAIITCSYMLYVNVGNKPSIQSISRLTLTPTRDNRNMVEVLSLNKIDIIFAHYFC
jgi:hypothetical protein